MCLSISLNLESLHICKLVRFSLVRFTSVTSRSKLMIFCTRLLSHHWVFTIYLQLYSMAPCLLKHSERKSPVMFIIIYSINFISILVILNSNHRSLLIFLWNGGKTMEFSHICYNFKCCQNFWWAVIRRSFT